MKPRLPLAVLLAVLASVSAAFAADGPSFNQVNPGTFDPAHTFLVQATWLSGIGCPTAAKTFDGTTTTPYTDPACTSGDPRDNRNEGLLLAKTGPTANFAAAGADLRNVKGIKLTELGYDIRKPAYVDPRGSHCGAGAPRFNVETVNGNTTTNHFVGCSSPPAMVTPTTSVGWIRLRWTPVELAAAFPPITPADNNVRSIQIIFDEGQDTGPDNFGLAVLDNIDVNGQLVGQGPRSNDRDNNNRDSNGRDRNNQD